VSSTLVTLQREIELRCSNIAAEVSDWPCRRGCDLCCRRLARIPEATAAEWEIVELDDEVRMGVERRVEELKLQSAPFTCPFLDTEAGSCLIYEQRPIACRTYGFYVEREAGLYCGDIQARVRRGELDLVVWGNQCGVDSLLDALGPRIPLTERRLSARPTPPR
jgi:uncharacterized protein